MSNLLQNGNFAIPSVSNFEYLGDMFSVFPGSRTYFKWITTSSSDVILINEVFATSFALPLPSLISQSQLLLFTYYLSRIYQSVEITEAGEYELSFYYSTRSGFNFLPIQIKVDTQIIGNIIIPPTEYTWVKFSVKLNVLTPKVITIYIQGNQLVSEVFDENIAIADVSLKLTSASNKG